VNTDKKRFARFVNRKHKNFCRKGDDETVRINQDCVVVITGAASGLGEATVRHLAELGAKIAILDIDEKRGEEVASEFKGRAIFFKTDITNETSVQAAIDETAGIFGGIQVVVNCAGLLTAAKVIGDKGPMPLDQFKRVLEINVIGTMNVIRLVAGKMIKNHPNEEGERGVIINTSSTAAVEGRVGQAAYSAAKAAIIGMTLPIAREFADYGIRVMTIAPGLFETPMTSGLPQKVKEYFTKMIPFPNRWGKPVEYAQLVRHIIENPMLNGDTIRIDAGLRMAGN
jgi:3-hydroxyacyl-CoA dehydrogenase / 3-hydroxy-2-methylbutyryl-CoA dehydrogenase